MFAMVLSYSVGNNVGYGSVLISESHTVGHWNVIKYPLTQKLRIMITKCHIQNDTKENNSKCYTKKNIIYSCKSQSIENKAKKTCDCSEFSQSNKPLGSLIL